MIFTTEGFAVAVDSRIGICTQDHWIPLKPSNRMTYIDIRKNKVSY